MNDSEHNPTDGSTTRQKTLPNQWLYYIIGLIGGFVSLFFWYASSIQTNLNLNHIISLQSEHASNIIQTQIDFRIASLKHAAKHLQEGPELVESSWSNHVTEFVNNYGEFNAIALLDSQLKPILVYPNDPDVEELFSLLASGYASDLMKVAPEEVWVSPPVIGNNRKQNIFLTVPFKGPHQEKNYLIALIDIKEIYDAQFKHEDYALGIYAGKNRIYENPNVAPSQSIPPKISVIHLYGTDWKIYIQPSAHLVGAIKTSLPTVALVLGIIIALLFIITTRLAELARQRAKSLDKSNSDLIKEIAERMEAEASKQKLEKELFQGQKLQAIGTLAGGIAHDFNNILYAVIGYVEMAREDSPPESLIYTNLGKVLDAAKRGQDLISRILAFSRRQHHELKPISITPTIESALELLLPTIPASVILDFNTTLPENFQILGDQTRLHQVMINLINNAVDAMDGEGKITITLTLIAKGAPILQQYNDLRPTHYCQIKIQDTGFGMDQNTLSRLFEPFFTTKEVGKGTGLGLATVHAAIKEHQGKIIVESQLGKGSTFIILLPEYKTGEENHGKNSIS